ncbi:14340_t:CDS:2, partial [Dentiscutata erythropus]
QLIYFETRCVNKKSQKKPVTNIRRPKTPVQIPNDQHIRRSTDRNSTNDIDEVSILSDNIYRLLMFKIGCMGSNYGPKTIPSMLDVHMNLEQSLQKIDEMLRKTVPPIVERVLREKYDSIIPPDKEQLNE